MLWSIIEDYFVIFSIGFIVGAITTRYYYERIAKHSLGKAIEGAVISNNVERLHGKSKDLENLLRQMMDESESLTGQIKRIRDIEKRKNDSDTIDFLEDKKTIEDEVKENDTEEP